MGEELHLDQKKHLVFDIITALLGLFLVLTLFLPWWHFDVVAEGVLQADLSINGFGFGGGKYRTLTEGLKQTDLESLHLLIQGIILLLLAIPLIFNTFRPLSKNGIKKTKIKIILSSIILTIVIFWLIFYGYYEVKFTNTGETYQFQDILEVDLRLRIMRHYGDYGIHYGAVLAFFIGLSLVLTSLIEYNFKIPPIKEQEVE